MSHAWEREVIGEDFDRGAWAKGLQVSLSEEELKSVKWHEMVSLAFLSWEDGELHQLLEAQDTGLSSRLWQMLNGRSFLSYLPRLLSSDIDVDRCDYILRDTLMTGVSYGRFDLDWLISTCKIGIIRDSILVAGFDSKKAIRVIEQYLLARRALYETVYYHKTVRAMEGMTASLLRVARDSIRNSNDLSGLGKSFTGVESRMVSPTIKAMKGEVLTLSEISSLDDNILNVFINLLNSPESDPTLRDLSADYCPEICSSLSLSKAVVWKVT